MSDPSDPSQASVWPPAPPPVVEAPPDTVAGAHPEDSWPLAEPMPMGPGTRAALDGLVSALCPAAPAPWSPALAENVALGARVFLRYMPPLLASGFVLAVHILDLSPLWRLRGLTRLRYLDRASAGAQIQRLAESRFKLLRLMVMAARAAILSTYYDQEEVHEAMGYQPMAFLQQRADLRRRLLAGARPTDSDLIGPSAEVLP